MASQDKVSGRMVVLVLFSGALILWAALFLVSYRKKLQNRGLLSGHGAAADFRDSTASPDSIRAWMGRLPTDWVKVSFVEGQGFALFVPCYSSNSALLLKAPPDSPPKLLCEFCDSLGEYAVTGMGLDRRDSTLDFRLSPQQGEMKILVVRDTLLKRFPETPFRDKLLLWIRRAAPSPVNRPAPGSPPDDPASPAGPAGYDTLYFIPKSMENEFEVLRAEDENPEGCGVEAE